MALSDIQLSAKSLSRFGKYTIPLLFLLGGFITDLAKHVLEGESLGTFFFGEEGIFAWQHVLLATGTLALAALILFDYTRRRI